MSLWVRSKWIGMFVFEWNSFVAFFFFFFFFWLRAFPLAFVLT
jgi:hypothetical protein